MKVKKKGLIIGIVAIVLIAAIGIAYSLSKAGNKTDELKKIEKTAKKEDKKKVKTAGDKAGKAEDEKTNAKSDVKSEDEEKNDGTEKAAKSENKGSKTSSSAKSSSSSTNPPSHSSSSSSGTAPAPKPKRWVVDQAAWDETVEVPVYKTVTEYWIRLTNGTILTYESWNECENAMDKYGSEVAANGSGSKQVLSGYNKTIIHHEEVGHCE
nr:MAG TPA: hypothetical protein [Caudoviricetes sp.]